MVCSTLPSLPVNKANPNPSVPLYSRKTTLLGGFLELGCEKDAAQDLYVTSCDETRVVSWITFVKKLSYLYP